MRHPDQVSDRLEYAEPIPDLGYSIFLTGPAEFLVAACAQELKDTPEWASLFGCAADDPGSIDTYKRMDYSIRQLPALRIYNESADKQFDSWFINGDLVMDIIWPASIRRPETQQIPDTVSYALLQQFRRPGFFDMVTSKVPGLNELGKAFSVDKSLGFEWGDDILPLTQIRANFRIDLRIWDDYLNQQGRTKDDPFNFTLEALQRIVAVVNGLRDDGSEEVVVQTDQIIDP